MRLISINYYKILKIMEKIIKYVMYVYSFTIAFPYHFIKGFVRGWRGQESGE